MTFRSMTDFDIGIGWQTWGNLVSVRNWVFNITTNRGLGEVTGKDIFMVMITVFGFYFRIYLLDRTIRQSQEKQDG